MTVTSEAPPASVPAPKKGPAKKRVSKSKIAPVAETPNLEVQTEPVTPSNPVVTPPQNASLSKEELLKKLTGGASSYKSKEGGLLAASGKAQMEAEEREKNPSSPEDINFVPKPKKASDAKKIKARVDKVKIKADKLKISIEKGNLTIDEARAEFEKAMDSLEEGDMGELAKYNLSKKVTDAKFKPKVKKTETDIEKTKKVFDEKISKINSELESGKLTPTQAFNKLESTLSETPERLRTGTQAEAKRKILESSKKIIQGKLEGEDGILSKIKSGKLTQEKGMSELEGMDEFKLLVGKRGSGANDFTKKVEEAGSEIKASEKRKKINELSDKAQKIITKTEKSDTKQLGGRTTAFNKILKELEKEDKQAATKILRDFNKAKEIVSLKNLEKQVTKDYTILINKAKKEKISPEDAKKEVEQIIKKKKINKQDSNSLKQGLENVFYGKAQEKLMSQKGLAEHFYSNPNATKEEKKTFLNKSIDEASKQYGLSSGSQEILRQEMLRFANSLSEGGREFDFKFRSALDANVKSLQAGTASRNAIKQETQKAIFAEKNLTKAKKLEYLRLMRRELSDAEYAVAQKNKKSSSFGIGATAALSIGGPMLAGYIQQAIVGNKERYELTTTQRIAERGLGTGVTAGGVGAAMGGSMFGLTGSIVGGAAGVLGGFIYALATASKSLDEFRQVTEKISNETETNAGIVKERQKMISDYIQSEQKATPLEKLKFQNQLNQNTISIKDKDLRQSISNAGMNNEALTEALKEYEKNRASDLLISQLGTSIKSAEYKDKVVGSNQAIAFTNPAFNGGAMPVTSLGPSDRKIFGSKSKEDLATNISPYSQLFSGITPGNISRMKEEAAKGYDELAEFLIETSGVLDKRKKKSLSESLKQAIGGKRSIFEFMFGEGATEFLELLKKKKNDDKVDVDLLRDSFFNVRKELQVMQTNASRNVKNLSLANKYASSFYESMSQIASGFDLGPELANTIQYNRDFSNLKIRKDSEKDQFTGQSSEKLFEQVVKTIGQQESSLGFTRKFNKDFFNDPMAAMNDLEKLLKDKPNLINQPIEGDALKKLIADLKETYEFQEKNINAEFQLLDKQGKLNDSRSVMVERQRLNAVAFEKNSIKIQSENDKGIYFNYEKPINQRNAKISRLNQSPFISEMEKTKREIQIRQEIKNLELQKTKKETSQQKEVVNAEAALKIADLELQKNLISSNHSLIGSIDSLKNAIMLQERKNAIKDKYKGLNDKQVSKFEALGGNPRENAAFRIQNITKNIELRNNEISEIENQYKSYEESRLKINEAGEKRITLLQEEIKLLSDAKKAAIDLAKEVKIDQEIEKANQEIDDLIAKMKNSSFAKGMSSGFNQIRNDVDNFHYEIGQRIPLSFRDNMVEAMNTAMDKAESLKDALRNAAIGFLTEMRNSLNQKAVGDIMTGGKTIFDSFRGNKQSGGVIKAQNGMYISGSRTGDKNPALLEDGEYVLNRNAVQAMGGPQALDRLNFSMAPRFATGGSAMLNEKISSKKLSGLFYATGNAELDEEKQRFEDEMRWRIAKNQERKMKRQALQSAIVSSAASAVLSGASGVASRGINNWAASRNQSYGPQQNIGNNISREDVNEAFESYSFKRQNGGHIPKGFVNKDSVPVFAAGGEYMVNNKAVRKYGLAYMERLNGGYIPSYQTGGATSSSNLGSQGSSYKTEININMNGNSSDQSSEGGTSDAETQKQLSKKIESAVKKVIQEEQRTTGLLSRGGRRL